MGHTTRASFGHAKRAAYRGEWTFPGCLPFLGSTLDLVPVSRLVMGFLPAVLTVVVIAVTSATATPENIYLRPTRTLQPGRGR